VEVLEVQMDQIIAAKPAAMVEIMVEVVPAEHHLVQMMEDMELKELLESFGQVVVVGFHQHA